MHPIQVISVNVSEHKGTIKTPVASIQLNPTGVLGDAHAGHWHRQVSLLGTESIAKGSLAAGRTLHPGMFAENITTQGFPLHQMNCLDRLVCGNIQLEVTQIGKKCHSGCEIFHEVGDCVMPKEGIFAKVLHGGSLKPGDVLEYHPKQYKAMAITMSDRASAGVYPDESGNLLGQILHSFHATRNKPFNFDYQLIPDDPQQLETLINKATAENYDYIFTTGGTGISPRDCAPDVVKRMLHKEIPGIMESVRMKYGTQFPAALLSRGVAGLIQRTLIFTLPGSPKAVREYMEEILKVLDHCVRMIHAIDTHS